MTDFDSREFSPDNAYKRGDLLYDSGRYGQALEAYQEHLLEYPEDAWALCQMAKCCLKLKLYGKASEFAEQAVAADPGLASVRYVQAAIFHARNLDEDAARAVDEALELDPTDPDILVLKGYTLTKKADWIGTLEAADSALSSAPYHAEALALRADALMNLQQYDEAEMALGSALENEPENISALYQLGNLHLHRGQWKEALETFQSALAIEPESPELRDAYMNALRAKFPLYGMMLRYIFWLNRFSKEHQNMIVYGSSFAARILRALREKYPALAPLIGLVLTLWAIFTYLTWTMNAATTLVLRCNEYGRSLVNEKETLESNLVGGMWFAALLCWLYGYFVDPFTMFCRIGVPIFLTLPLVVGGALGTSEYGWPKYVAYAILGIMTVASILGLFLFTFGVPLGLTLLLFYFNALGPVLLVLSFLASHEPEKH